MVAGLGGRRRSGGSFTFTRYNWAMPTVHQELEIKYDADEAFEVPPLTELVRGHQHGTPVVEGEPETHRLEATYFDTSDHRLARAHLTLRRRTGGTDAGWHLKVPGVDGARQEVRLPLGRSTATVPAALRRLVRVATRGGQLRGRVLRSGRPNPPIFGVAHALRCLAQT